VAEPCPAGYLTAMSMIRRRAKPNKLANSASLQAEITARLKNIPEQQNVVGPLVKHLVGLGWSLGQIVFGKHEWRVPKSPSEATKREKKQSFSGFPVDIAVFDDESTVGDPRHILFMIECKQPTETAGIAQLESYFVGEPHVRLGMWANDPTPSASGVFLYRQPDGRILLKRQKVADFPRPGEPIRPELQRLTFNDLIAPTDVILKKTVEDLLDKIVIGDSNVTRREEQLDQLCNLLLLKLESDKQAKSEPSSAVFFRPLESAAKTASAMRTRYEKFVELYPEVFVTDQDKSLRFSNETIASCVEELSGLKLIDLGVSTIALAFQVLRSEALKQGEGQYFTPQAVITAGVRLMKIQFDDISSVRLKLE
jgi:type I restriction enzyme M protein